MPARLKERHSAIELLDRFTQVRDTYARVCKEWQRNAAYWTEFVLVLNHKIWEHYKSNEPLGRLYDELWREADRWAVENLKGEELERYYEITD